MSSIFPDDMNIIQVGRPAVSRYHQIKGFFPPGETPNFAVHDFPNSEYGIKLGGFMIMGGQNLSAQNRRAQTLFGGQSTMSILISIDFNETARLMQKDGQKKVDRDNLLLRLHAQRKLLLLSQPHAPIRTLSTQLQRMRRGDCSADVGRSCQGTPEPPIFPFGC